MKKSIMTIAAVIGIMAAATTTNAAGVTIKDAKKTALTAAGLTEKEVIFTQVSVDYDDGYEYYEVDFIVPGKAKYDFDINMNTGDIMERDYDMWEYDDDYEYAYLIEQARK